MSKNLDYTILFDIYGPLLTDKQRETLDLYYNEDLSLGEIAETMGVTRQAVMGCIQKCEQHLDELESLMGLAERNREIERLLGEIERGVEWLRANGGGVQFGYNMETNDVGMFQSFGLNDGGLLSGGGTQDTFGFSGGFGETPEPITDITEKIRKLL